MEAVLEKIKKLLAFQEDAKKRDSQAELENVTQKIQTLLTKHNLELGDIEVKPEGVEEGYLNSNELSYNKKHGQWTSHLVGTLAQFNLCKIILQGYSGGILGISIMGMPHNVQVVKYLALQLIPRIKALEKDSWSNYKGRDKRGAYRRSYLVNVVMGIRSTLQEQENLNKAHTEGVTALIVTHDEAIQGFINTNYGKLDKQKTSRLGSRDGARRGFTDGKSMELQKGIK